MKKGRFYGGTLSQIFCNATPSSAFYQYTRIAGVDLWFNGVFSTTGFVLNEYLDKMYHLDICKGLITEFCFDPKTSDICYGRAVFDFGSVSREPVVPVGLELDSHRFLYE